LITTRFSGALFPDGIPPTQETIAAVNQPSVDSAWHARPIFRLGTL
jgi:hypothetical protein